MSFSEAAGHLSFLVVLGFGFTEHDDVPLRIYATAGEHNNNRKPVKT